jgi:magnesium transporter
MEMGSLLKPELMCPGLPGTKPAALAQLVQCVARVLPSLEAPQILDAIARRERLGPVALGRGIAFCHVRTEKVSDLVIALGTSPEGVSGFETPDNLHVRLIALFLIPKQHSDLYLRAVAFLTAAVSAPSVLDRLLAARGPQEMVESLQPAQPGEEIADLLAKLASNGPAAEIDSGVLDRIPAVDLANMAEDLTPVERAKVLSKLEDYRAAAIAGRMHIIPLAAALRRMPPESAARILAHMDTTRATDVLRRLNTDEQASILNHLMPRNRGEVGTRLKYPPSKAGGFMSPEVVTFAQGVTVEQALKAIASFKDRRQTDAYVTADDGKLLGKCAVQELLTADPQKPLGEVMNRNPETVPPDREHVEIRRLMALRDAHSLPVVTREGTLVGVVTQDDLLDVIEQEAHEDIVQMAGTKLVDPIHTPISLRIRLRIPWLLLTLGGELFIALVITKVFHETLEKAVVLAAFIPAIMATGGNVGLQATTIIIRGLGMGTLKAKHMWRVIGHEMLLGVLLGFFCGVIAGVVAYLINWEHHEVMKISASVFIAMLSATLATSFVGTLEPLLLHRLKFDPATACGPFVTMFNDIFGSIVYLVIAMLMNFSPPK